MTDFVLRPLSLGELLGRTFALLRHRAAGILAAILVAMVLPLLMIANRIPRLMELGLTLQRNPADREALRAVTALMGGMFLVGIVGMLGFLVARTAAAWIAHKTLLGDRADIFEALEKGIRFLPAMLGLMLVEGVIYGVVIGALYFAGALLVLGQLRSGTPPAAVPLILWVLSLYGAMVFITTGLFATPSILLAEDGAMVFGAIGRSFALTKGRRAAIFGGILVLMVVSTLVYLGVDLVVGFLTGEGTSVPGRGMPVLIAANLILNLLAMSFYFVFQMVIYYDLRIRKEGLDLDLAADAGKPPAKAKAAGRPSASAPARSSTPAQPRPSAPPQTRPSAPAQARTSTPAETRPSAPTPPPATSAPAAPPSAPPRAMPRAPALPPGTPPRPTPAQPAAPPIVPDVKPPARE